MPHTAFTFTETFLVRIHLLECVVDLTALLMRQIAAHTPMDSFQLHARLNAQHTSQTSPAVPKKLSARANAIIKIAVIIYLPSFYRLLAPQEDSHVYLVLSESHLHTRFLRRPDATLPPHLFLAENLHMHLETLRAPDVEGAI